MAAKRYSRLARVEQGKNKRKTFIYVILSVVFLIILLFYGIPTLAKLASLLNDLGDSNTPIVINDKTPPAPPFIEILPEYTNLLNIEVKGTSEPGATIILSLNNEEREIVANNSGSFIYKWGLLEGKNTISAIAKDPANNISQKSDVFNIILDVEPPSLEILSPDDGTSYYGSRERQAVMEGVTDEGMKVTVNGRIVVVESGGSFTYSTTLNEGDNNFNFISEDRAGNQTVEGITLYFWR